MYQVGKEIERVMNDFDFDKTADLFEYLQWEWADNDDGNWSYYVPDKQQIKDFIRKELFNIVESAEEAENRGEFEERYSIDGGGFLIELLLYDDEERKSVFGEDAPDDFEHSVELTVRFVPTECVGKFW